MMKIIKIISIFLFVFFLKIKPASAVSAFPNAVGFGSQTTGGRGGTVCIVTSLSDSGSGSLRDCVSKSGPRIITFNVSGTIQLTGHIKIDNPFIYIAGQTSPNGIQIKGAGIKIRTHDVVIRGLMIRPGNESTGAPLEDRTGLIIHNDKDSSQPYNIVIDHNSIEWGVDESASTWLPSNNITFSNNIFAEGLNCAGHPDGCHSMGLQIGAGAKNVTVYGNLIANNDWRNPIMQENTSVEVINNLIYSWGAGGIIVQGVNGSPNFINALGNYTKATSCSSGKGILIDSSGSGSKLYSDDWNNITGSYSSIKSTALSFSGSGISPMSANDTYQFVLDKAGARNDSVDKRVKNNTRNGTLPNNKCFINSQSEVGGWPVISNGNVTDSDNDGLPDSFELSNGGSLNPTSIAPSGYSWIEEYANSLFNSTTIVPITNNTAQTQAPKQTIETTVVKLGDANSDNKVDNLDYNIWLGNYLKSLMGVKYGDFDLNSIVDGVDYVIWLNNYAK